MRNDSGMLSYMDAMQSLDIASGGDSHLALRVIADHFIGSNPENPYLFKVDFRDGIKMDGRGRYQFFFERYFPDASEGECCCASGKLWSYHDRTTQFDIVCIGPTKCYVDGSLVFESVPNQEGNRETARFKVSLKKGYNEFVFITEKTRLGFGFICGNFMPQWEPYLFQAPGKERSGQLGFVFSKPFRKEQGSSLSELEFPFPVFEQDFFEKGNEINTTLAFGENGTGHAYIKAKAIMHQDGYFKISNHGKVQADIAVDGKWENGKEEVLLNKGTHLIVIHLICPAPMLFLELQNGEFQPVVPVLGYSAVWLYLGVFSEALSWEEDFSTMNRIYGEGTEECYWKPLPDNMELRPCVETELFGRFTYPMGVTLYGLLKAADYLGEKKYADYVKSGVEKIVGFDRYALFDKRRNGFPSLNQQICWLEELDDCGSFGSLILECCRHWEIEGARSMADRIAEHMEKRQNRREDGAFCRQDDTMWVDDLYMSIPFLTRYYQLTGEKKYLDDACRQVLMFQKYCYIKEKRLISHIYDIKWERANEIPWSRGNGWVLFSISELLEALPESDSLRNQIVCFFQELSEGLLNVQDESGMWHQILDDPETYLESSATAMFICAFARSIRRGYAKEECRNRLYLSVKRAWRGLLRLAVDSGGNLYGVCQGSGRSFSRDYYRKLSWRYNDAHGIGIVLLAGVEKDKLEKEWV